MDVIFVMVKERMKKLAFLVLTLLSSAALHGNSENEENARLVKKEIIEAPKPDFLLNDIYDISCFTVGALQLAAAIYGNKMGFYTHVNADGASEQVYLNRANTIRLVGLGGLFILRSLMGFSKSFRAR